MSTLSMSPGVIQRSTLSADDLFARQVSGISRRTDRLFAVLLAFQWIAALVAASLHSPRAWEGESSGVHAHVWAATLLGGAMISLPIALSLARAGATSTRHVIAVAQVLMGALLIHLTDGRIETHFHVFGSLALLAFYRDWRVLVTASAVIAIDHLVRGLCWPRSIFGVLVTSPWRWAEHTAWVIVEDIFLIRSCLQNVGEMRGIAGREADLARANQGLAREVAGRVRAESGLLRAHEELEARVAKRTADLGRANQGLTHEVAERGRAEEAQARLAAIVESSGDAVVSMDLAGRFTSWNAGAEHLYGYTAEEMVGAPITRLIPPDRRSEEPEILERLRRGERVEHFESIRMAKDGRMLDVSLTISPIRDAAGEIIGASKIARNIADRKRAEQEVRLLNSRLGGQLKRLDALRQIDIAIATSFDMNATLGTLLDQVKSQLGVDAADVLLLDPRSRTLKYANGRGFRADSMQQVVLPVGRSVPGLVVSEGTPLHLPDLSQSARPFLRARALEEEGFVAYSVVPLVSQGVIKGVLEVFHRSPIEADREWRDFLEVLAEQAVIAIDSATLFRDLQRSNAELTVAYDATIEGWSRALDLRDKETEGHTRRVTEMAVRLARAMGITGDDLTNVRRGALLHDIGKLGVPDAILLKPGKLTDEEWVLMRRHPTYAYEWLSPIAFLRPALDIPYCHHEKLDGTGYPRGLKGEQIPLSARIFAVVDIWDALRSDRPYRRGWPGEQVIESIRSLAGTHLDPAVVEAFRKCLAADSVGPVDGPAAAAAARGVDRAEEASAIR